MIKAAILADLAANSSYIISKMTTSKEFFSATFLLQVTEKQTEKKERFVGIVSHSVQSERHITYKKLHMQWRRRLGQPEKGRGEEQKTELKKTKILCREV